MKSLNRCALLVRPLEPYFAWANRVGDELMDEIDAETSATIYLAESVEDEEHVDALVEQQAEAIFRAELAQWNEDESTWPEKRDADALTEWFEISVIPLVVDLSSDELKHENLLIA